MTASTTLDFNDPRVVLSDYRCWETAFPQKGESKIYVGEQVPLGYLYLTSAFWIPEGTSKWYTDGQLVKVWKRQNGYAYLDEPLRRTFHAPGLLYNVPVEVGRTYMRSGVLRLSFIAEAEINHCDVPDGWSGKKGVDLQAFSRVTVRNMEIGRPLDPTAYGLGVQYGTGLYVENLTTHGCRHPVIPWCISGAYFKNVVHAEPTHDFDFGHGFVEDVVWDGCDGGDRNGAVNNRWPAPCNMTITRQRNTRDLLVYSGSRVEVNQSKFNDLRIIQERPEGVRVDTDWGSFKNHRREFGLEHPCEMVVR